MSYEWYLPSWWTARGGEGRTREGKSKLEGENCWTRWMMGTFFYFAFWLHFVLNIEHHLCTRPFLSIHVNNSFAPCLYAKYRTLQEMWCHVHTMNNYFDPNRWLGTFDIKFIVEILWNVCIYFLLSFSLVIKKKPVVQLGLSGPWYNILKCTLIITFFSIPSRDFLERTRINLIK